MPKVGTQLLLNPRDRDRVRALALVRGQLQAEMLRDLVEHALSVYEALHKRELTELQAELSRLGQGGDLSPRAVQALLVSRISLPAVRRVDEFPVPL